MPSSKCFEDLVPGTWYSISKVESTHIHPMEYEGPHEGHPGEHIFKDRRGYRFRYTTDYLVSGPVPREEMTPIEKELHLRKEKGYPPLDDNVDSAPGYLRHKDLVIGQWYMLENYGGGHSFKGEYRGIGYGTASVFVCKYGSSNLITTKAIKPVDRISDWYVSGPIPKDELTEADS